MKKIAVWAALLLAISGLSEATAGAPMPENVGIFLSDFGPVFTDSSGMTLYTSGRDVRRGVSECNDTRMTVGLMGDTTFKYPLPDFDKRKTCAQKWPPFLASSDAKAAGKWTVITRADGARQWAYDGRPLYRSIKDKAPGDVNGGGFMPAKARLEGAPPSVGTEQTRAGLVLATNPDGRTLYTFDSSTAPSKSGCDAECMSTWQPWLAPALGVGRGADWTVIRRADGTKQWVYKGKPLYTNVKDVGRGSIAGEGIEGWRLALLKAAPEAPPGIIIKRLPSGDRVYANAEGSSLYTFSCNEEAPDDLSCDDPGDSSIYFTAICGGPERCAEIFRPLTAPKNAKADGNIWSIRTINPNDPLKIVTDETTAVRVWAYRGRPIFTYARDRSPKDSNGHLVRLYAISSFMPIPAYSGNYGNY